MNMKLLLLVFLGNSYPTKGAERLDVKFPSSAIGSYMKELIVCVSGLDPGKASPLPELNLLKGEEVQVR
jgi:hypothetical protein